MEGDKLFGTAGNDDATDAVIIIKESIAFFSLLSDDFFVVSLLLHVLQFLNVLLSVSVSDAVRNSDDSKYDNDNADDDMNYSLSWS